MVVQDPVRGDGPDLAVRRERDPRRDDRIGQEPPHAASAEAREQRLEAGPFRR